MHIIYFQPDPHASYDTQGDAEDLLSSCNNEIMEIYHSLSRVIVPATLHLYLCQRLKIIFFIPRVNIDFYGW
jgi:hypothetical protein